MSVGRGDRQRILVVCYGNICRSPTAEALLKRALQSAGLESRYIVRSAGVGAQPEARAARGAIDEAAARGIQLGAHRARQLTAEMAREASIVVALDEIVEEEIAILAGDVEVVLWPVDDPYGGAPQAYKRAFDEIEAHVTRFVRELRSRATAR